MNEHRTAPVTSRPNFIIDWIRDECDEATQQGVALRQALRFLPSIFACDDEVLVLRHCRALMTAFVDLQETQKPARSERIALGRFGLEPPSVANASLSIREAVRAVLRKDARSSPTDREVELSLADGFDTLRDLFEESTGIPVKDDFPEKLIEDRQSMIQLLTEDCNDILGHGNGFVFTEPLWSLHVQKPRPFTYSDSFLERTVLETPRSWSFWRRWYQGFLDGQPLDRALQCEIASIKNSVWDEGPEAIALEIDRILREMAGPSPLERDVLVTHVQQLLQNPMVSKSAALNGAVSIEIAIQTYKHDAPANCLPDGMEHLEQLPVHFRAIAAVFDQASDASTKEADLVAEIQKLHARVTELERDLAVAKSKTLKGTISKNAAESFGKTIGSPVFYGGIAVSACHFFGVAPLDITFENFRGFVDGLMQAAPDSAPEPRPSLPTTHDI